MDKAPPYLGEAMALVAEFNALHARPPRNAYEHTGSQLFEVRVVPVELVQCHKRNPGVPGLVRERALSVLWAFRSNAPLPPVNVHPAPVESDGYLYVLYHGYHRFHLSVAAGYTHVPVAINFANGASAA